MVPTIRKLALWLATASILLPVALVVTIFIHPFWRWFEERTGIEAYGHSGPAGWCYWFDYVLLLVLYFLLAAVLAGARKNRAA